MPSMDEENDLRRFLIRGTGSQLADNKSLKDMLDDIEGSGFATNMHSLVTTKAKLDTLYDNFAGFLEDIAGPIEIIENIETKLDHTEHGLAALKTLIDAIETKVEALGGSSISQIEAKLDHADHGLAAIKTLIDAIEAKIDALKRVIYVPIYDILSPGSWTYTTYTEILGVGPVFNKSKFGKISAIYLVGLMRITDATKTVYAKLYNKTDSEDVVNSEISHTGDTTYTICKSADIKDSFPDKEVQLALYLKVDGGTGQMATLNLLIEQAE